MFNRVYDDPDEWSHRRVLADVLDSAGDPRGEFIHLQCLPARTREQDATMNRLRQAHWRTWLGDLAPLCKAAGFDGGFPVRLTLEGKAKTAAAARGADGFRTVRHIHIRKSFLADDTLNAVLHPACDRLTSLTGVADAKELRRVMRSQLKLTHLGLQGWRGDWMGAS